MKLYLVGGTIREHLFGIRDHKDLDFAVEAPTYWDMRADLLDRGLEVWQERPEFVTIRGRIPLDQMGDFGGLVVARDIYRPGEPRRYLVDADFTLCRQERMYHDNRHPSVVTPTDILTDLSRRDFTINAIAVSETGDWLDPHGGQRDAMDLMLRTVGDPYDRFSEDPLRMLRALRFATKHNLIISGQVQFALGSCSRLIGGLPVERVRQELGHAMRTNWFRTTLLLGGTFRAVGVQVSTYYPTLWLKATTEER